LIELTPSPLLPSYLRFGQVSLNEAEHLPAQSSCQRRYTPMVFGIIPKCRSVSPESPFRSISRNDRPICEVITDRVKNIPDEVFDRRPNDGASQVDHYIYGLPKRD
jgi:hypothetical protein